MQEILDGVLVRLCSKNTSWFVGGAPFFSLNFHCSDCIDTEKGASVRFTSKDKIKWNRDIFGNLGNMKIDHIFTDDLLTTIFNDN